MAPTLKALKKGDTIGIVSPSSTSDPAVLVKGKAVLEAAGYRVILHPQNDYASGHLAGSDEQRATALMALFADPAIDAIVCGRGGNGAIRLLDRLDYDLIRRNPKIFVGYSDITVLHHAIRNM
jgi:muramoyltetrapeptide carboxypeptidase